MSGELEPAHINIARHREEIAPQRADIAPLRAEMVAPGWLVKTAE